MTATRRLAVLSNGAHRTGAPLSLIALLERRPPDVVISLASVGDGPLIAEYERVADMVEILPAPRTRGVRPRRLVEEARTWLRVRDWGRRHHGWTLLVNTCEYEAGLFLARGHDARSLVAVREMTTYLQGPRGRVRGELMQSPRVHLAGVGRSQAQAWQAALGRPVEHLVNVYEHDDDPVVRPPGRPLRLLFVGGTTARKGLDLAIDAFQRAGLAGKAELLLAGAGGDTDGDASSIDGVRRLGVVEDLGHRIADIADVVLAVSRAEPFSRTVVEAALAGVPTVAWRTDGYVEQITELGGWLVEPFDVDALAMQLRALASMGDEEYKRVSTAVAASARRVFDPDAAARRWWEWIFGETG